MSKTDQNPNNLCAWDDNSDCANCADNNLLFCKLNPKMSLAFSALFSPAIITAFFVLVIMGFLTGTWWYLIAYGSFFVVLFPAIEFGVLCRHCPYYGNKSKTLTCVAGSGVPKTYKYNPAPMKKWEHRIMYTYYTFMIGFPIVIAGYGIYLVATDISYNLTSLLMMIAVETALVLSMISFNYVLNVYVCSKCVNFSCPWNGVEKKVVDEYLRKNPVMKEAWEKSGYKLDEE